MHPFPAAIFHPITSYIYDQDSNTSALIKLDVNLILYMIAPFLLLLQSLILIFRLSNPYHLTMAQFN
jgi:hypothetical protein